MEEKIKEFRSPNVINTLNAARRELDSLLSDKVEGTLIIILINIEKYYEYGNRGSRLLAFRLRKLQSSNTIENKITRSVCHQTR